MKILYSIRIAAIAVAIFLFTSCSCDYYMSQVKKKCPSSLEKDTLIIHDTIKISTVKKDTIFKYFQKDTVIIKEGKLTMKYFYNNHDSTIYLSGKCDSIKIVREIQIPVEKTIFKYDFLNSNKFLLAAVSLLLCLVLVIYLLKNK